jgi:two-component system phosphate regulon sensor histidine kinase PhoR
MRLLGATLLLAAPWLAALLVVTVAGGASPLPALGLAALGVVATGLLMRPTVAALTALQRNLLALADDASARPAPVPRSPFIDEAAIAAARLARALGQRQQSGEAELQSAAAVLEALPDPLVLLDGERRILRVNRAAAAALGTHVVGRDLATALRHPALLAAADSVLRGGGGQVVEFQHPGPEERSSMARVAPLERSASERVRAILTLHDVTALKRTERMRADFVAHASHELRTPLATMSGFIETLRGPARDDAAARERFLAIMAEQARRMTRLVEDLLSLSRIEASEHLAPTGAVDIEKVLRGVADAIALKTAEREMRIELRAAPGLPLVVGDSDELAQLFLNLLDNALKYGRRGTPVVVTVERAASAGQDGVAVAVRDQGEGIPREHIPRLTERFYRVDAARSRDIGGTGLGLAIVKHIVGRHRGTLSIGSVPGEGSTFTVRLRASPPDRG